jgi:hypothetical protein
MKLELSTQIFETYSNIKFRENPSTGSRVVPCGRADITKLIGGFRNFSNAPKKWLRQKLPIFQRSRNSRAVVLTF